MGRARLVVSPFAWVLLLAAWASLGCRGGGIATRPKPVASAAPSVSGAALVARLQGRAPAPPPDEFVPTRPREPPERHFSASKYPGVEKPNFVEESWHRARRPVLDFSTRYQLTTERLYERGFHIDSDGAIWFYMCEGHCRRRLDPDTWDTSSYDYNAWLQGRLTHDKLQALLQAVAAISDRDVSVPNPKQPDLRWWAGLRERRRWPTLFGSSTSTLMIVGDGTGPRKPLAVAACGHDYPTFQLDSPSGRTVIDTFWTAGAVAILLEVCGNRIHEPEVFPNPSGKARQQARVPTEIAPGVLAWWWPRP
jgi:hypothetical protein